jgi:membrane associated rhomboid family serine protease
METQIRSTPSARQADEWVLVLTALRIPHRIEIENDAWIVVVPDEDAARARAALRAHDREGRPAPEPPAIVAASSRTAWTVGLASAAILVGIFLITGPPSRESIWFTRGSAAASAMLGGEPWRAATALLLHVDLVHVLGNALAAAVFLPPIVRRLGPGVGLLAVLLAGTAGNLLAGAVQGPQHVAVGASTATFGALGVLVALRLTPGSGGRSTRGRRFVIPIAGLLLLGMLGMGPGTDVVAHTFGLVAGAAFGYVASLWKRPLPPPGQQVLLAGAVIGLAWCWYLALAAR